MQDILKILSSFDLDDIYNMDEIGYWYRMESDRRVCIEQLEASIKNNLQLL